MRSLHIPIFLLSACLAACSSGSSSAEPGTSVAASVPVRIKHASPDAPAVDVLVDGNRVVEGLNFGDARQLDLAPGTYRVEVEGRLPGSSRPTVLGPLTLQLLDDREYSIVATGELANLDALVFEDDEYDDDDDDRARLRIVHAAPNAPRVDVYLTAPSALLAASTPATSLAAGESFGPTTVPEGEYRIRVTRAGRRNDLLFDSGTVDLDDDDDLLVTAIDNVFAGSSPISLIVFDGDDDLEVRDEDDEAEVRIVHVSPDAGPVDIYVDGELVEEDLDYGDDTDFEELDAGTYQIVVTPAGMPSVVAIDAPLTVASGQAYSVLAIGLVTDGSIRPLVLDESRRRVASEAQLQIVHGAPSAEAVDVYVVPENTPIGNREPEIAGLTFEASATLSLPDDDYEVIVTAPGSKRPVIGPISVDLDDDEIYTAIARDAEGTGAPFGLILLDGDDD